MAESEEEKADEGGADTGGAGGGEASDQGKPGGKKKKKSGKGTGSLIGNPLILVLGLTTMVIMTAAAALFFLLPEEKKVQYAKALNIPMLSDNENDNLTEDVIDPFYIPTPDSSDHALVKLNMSVIWDGLAQVRYRSREVELRGTIYRMLTDMASDPGGQAMKQEVVERELTMKLRATLSVQNLQVKVKDILFF